MNDVKTTFYKTLNIIVGTNRVDNEEAYIINDYISRLEATIKDEQQEISRLNKKYENSVADYEEQKYIISELEKYLETEKDNHSNSWHYREWIRQVFDKLKELKEGK